MEHQTTRPLRFTRVTVDNWRNFGHIDVALFRRAFIVGPNASGKSNFLDVFRFLHDIVSVGRGFEQAVASRGGVSSLRALAARRYSDISILVSIGIRDIYLTPPDPMGSGLIKVTNGAGSTWTAC